jgi:exopolysaccharide biosynthesis polyprenyl glycosylphosphotransferase
VTTPSRPSVRKGSPMSPADTSPGVTGQRSGGRPRSPTHRRRELGRWLAYGDSLVIALASLLAFVAREQLGRFPGVRGFAEDVPVAIAVIPLWLLVFYFAGAYRPEYLNAGGDAFRRFVAGVAGGVLVVGFVSFALNLQLSRLYVLLLAAFVFIGGGALRYGMRRYLQSRYRRGELVQRSLLVGTDDAARQLAGALASSPDSSYEVVGYLDDRTTEKDLDGLPVLGSPRHVGAICAQNRIGCVIVSPAGVEPGALRDVTIALEGSEVDLVVSPSLFQVVTRRMTIETVGNVPLLHVDQIRLRRGKAALKRSLDLLGALSLLVAALPMWGIAALAIRWDSPGPAHFTQRRVGREGHEFTMLKLRTMVEDAEERRPDLVAERAEDGLLFKMEKDPRITRVGRHLRRWSIDELPQLLNVLRGDMSLVGPRPPLPEEVQRYEPWHLRRLRVRPGVTGIWQVSGRSDVPFDEAVRMDLFYIENWSLGTDLLLLARTVGAVISRRGAW